MNRTFTINEEVIRRLTLRRDLDERAHEHARHSHTTNRLMRGLLGILQQEIVPRARWS